MGAGAYGFSMSSSYNSRPRVAEVMVRGSEYFVVRERETYTDLIKGEKIPRWLEYPCKFGVRVEFNVHEEDPFL